MLYPSFEKEIRGIILYQAPRGTSDILPEQQIYWNFLEEKAVNICQLYGYERIDTPTFEDTMLFVHGVGDATDIVDKEMYTFSDKGGNKLTLRPEGTAPVCRAYMEHGLHNLPQPVKLYYISPIFRYDRPQAGRYRQHHQFGCEAIGSDDSSLDAEVIDMAWQFFSSLKLKNLTLKLNSIGCKKCRPGYLDFLKNYYNEYVASLCPDCQIRLIKNPLRLLDCKKPSCQPLADSAPRSIEYLCPQCDEHFKQLQGYLGLLEVPFEIDHRLVRGLDYYSRTVFEIHPGVEGAQSSLGGGGRYDGLIEELGGKPTPAIGFGLGMERIILNLKEQKIAIPPLPGPQVFIAHIGDEAREEAIKLASSLRQAGIRVIETIGDRSLKAQLRQANTLGVQHSVIIGEDEIRNDTVILRDMTSARQDVVPVTGLNDLLRRYLRGED